MRVQLKAVLFVVTVVSVLSMPIAAAPVSNYVENHSFEQWEDGQPANWSVVDGQVEPTDDATDGELAVLLNSRGSSLNTTISQNVTAEPQDVIVDGYDYDFVFDAKLGQGASNRPTSDVLVQGIVLWKDASGEVIQRDTVEIEHGEYREYNATFRAPPGATDAEIRFQVSRESHTDRTDANLKVDDVAFGPSDQGTGVSL